MKILVAALLVLVGTVHSFDGNRKGFVLGGGLGGSFTTFNQEVSGFGMTATSDQVNKAGFATGILIGYGISNTLLVNYFSHTNWFSLKNANEEKVTIANGNAGLQLVKYLNDGRGVFVPSPYVYGGLGWSGWSTPFENNGTSWLGLGASVGAGYEFTQHLSLQLGVFFTNPSEEENDLEFQSNSVGFHLQLVGLAY